MPYDGALSPEECARMLLLSIGSLRFFGLDRVFMLAKDLGFDGVEVIVDDRWDTADPGYLRTLSARYSLPIPSLHSPFSFIPTPAWGTDPVERMRRSVALAEEIGSEVLVIHLAFFADARYAAWVRDELPRWQEKTAVKLAVENMPHAFKMLGVAVTDDAVARIVDRPRGGRRPHGGPRRQGRPGPSGYSRRPR